MFFPNIVTEMPLLLSYQKKRFYRCENILIAQRDAILYTYLVLGEIGFSHRKEKNGTHYFREGFI